MLKVPFLYSLGALFSIITVFALYPSPREVNNFEQKFSAQLKEAFEHSNEERYIIKFAERATFPDLENYKTKFERGAYVHQQLGRVAHKSQQEVISFLEENMLPYRKLEIINSIVVTTDIETARQIASYRNVKKLIFDPWIKQPLAHRQGESNDLNAIMMRSAPEPEWGILNIGADRIWSFDNEGEGITVAGADTGYEWFHPSLRNQYRGNTPDTVDHNYHWHDAIHEIDPNNGDSIIVAENNPCGLDVPFPCDDNDHGTHTMGTMVGQDSANIIGVAPKAKWIACRNMERGSGTPSTYIECFNWFIAPTDLNGENPDPTKAPHVINNSWSCPEVEGCNPDNFALLQEAVEAVRAASIFVVVSAGNGGNFGCETVSTPAAMFDASFTIGAYNSEDNIASFSSRGPVSVDSSFRLKPDMSAPGVSVRSSTRNGNYRNLSGTSMAGPHVAGAVALLMQADTTLQNDMDRMEQVLLDYALPRTTEQMCGEIPGDQVPNHTYGMGNLRIFEAFLALTGNTVSNDHVNLEIALDIFPNPASDVVYWRTAEVVDIEQVSVYDMAGRRMLTVSDGISQGQLDVSALRAGIYMIHFDMGDERVIKKVVVE